jgi:hypothetical protein
LAKEAQLPARLLGPNKIPIGRFEVSMSLIDSSKSFKPLKIRFESRTMALTNLTTFGVAVEATVLMVEVEVEDR